MAISKKIREQVWLNNPMSMIKEVKLHNEKNPKNYRWLIVTNSIEGTTHHRDFKYYKYKVQFLWHKLVFKIFWGGFGPDLFLQAYDMKNLTKWEPGKLTKDLIKSGYFNELRSMGQGRKIRY